MTNKSKPVDYLDLMARKAEEERNADWTEKFPEPQGDKAVDYTLVAEAWEEERARIISANEQQ